MTASLHPAAPHHLPAFISAAGETDVLMTVVAVFLVVAVMVVGLLFLRLHTLPERLAHKGHKLQFEIVAVLGLLALFTHIHAFWVAGLLLALIDIPDFGWPLRRIAGSVEKIAGIPPGKGADGELAATVIDHVSEDGTAEVPKIITLPRMPKERTDA
jgi:NADH:ubiquinone oxidoreductase subunit 5 (subunit L)/multisubunit Na+/H+ antiporter MnhA subunit